MDGVSYQVTITIEPEEYQALKKCAESQSLGVSDFLRSLVRRELASQPQKSARS